MANPLKAMKNYFAGAKEENAFRLDGALPLRQAIPFGLQHLLAVFVSNITPILLILGAKTIPGTTDAVVDNAVRGAIFIAALATIIQLFPIWRFGSKLPVFCGSSFVFIGVLALVSSKYGLGTMYLSIILGGLFAAMVGLFAFKWRKWIKPIVPAMVVFTLGLSLIYSGLKDFLSFNVPGVLVAGTYDFSFAWPYLIVAVATLLTTVLWQIFVKGIWKNVSLLVGLLVGYGVALCFIPYNGMVSFDAIRFESVADFIDVPKPYFVLSPASVADFKLGPILVVALVYLASFSSDIGVISTVTSGGLSREASDKEISGGLSWNGLSSALGGFFGAFPLCAYAQNAGIVASTKVVNRNGVLTGAILLLVSSFFPIVSRFFQTIPVAVIGGLMLPLYASIVLSGFRMLANLGFTKKNILILFLSLGIAVGLYVAIEVTEPLYDADALNYLMLFLGNPVAMVFVLSLLLSYVIPDSINRKTA